MDIVDVQKKVDEVKALFVLAQRVIPFVEDLFAFISETSPLLEDLNTAIKDNLKKMPNATKQLTKVTQATEIASTEIMDTVDRVNEDLYKVIKELEDFKEIQSQVLENPLAMLETIAGCIRDGKDLAPMLDDIRLFIERAKNITTNEHTTIIANIVDKVTDISNDANSIINSLQMQDITTQQLAAVNNLLENVTSRLTGIMTHLNSPNPSGERLSAVPNDNTKISTLHREIAFDPDAIDSLTLEGRQDDIDAMFANPDVITMDDDTASSDEEDATDLLNGFASQANDETTTDIEDEVEEFSQDDIDALFG